MYFKVPLQAAFKLTYAVDSPAQHRINACLGYFMNVIYFMGLP